MDNQSAKNFINSMLQSIGITVNGHAAFDIQINNNDFYTRVLQQGPLGLGESYMDQWWDAPHLDEFFNKVLRAHLDQKIKVPLRFAFKILLAKIINFQNKHHAKKVADTHYNLGNDLFKAMLDSRLMYSCGYWKEATTLDDAQVAKLDLVCQKLHLQPGQRVLDIGCGWGGFAKFAAENYGVSVVGITISKEQATLAKELCAGLPIDIRLQDYRDIDEKFDRIASIGMFEHVGHRNYHTYMQAAHRLLNDDGLFLLHTIGVDKTASFADEWTLKYIFPHGMLPSTQQIAKAAENFFVIEDWQNFGAYYDKTLMSWHHNFVKHWDQLKHHYDDRFYRMWTYYLLSCAGAFRARTMQVWQVVFSKEGVGGYKAVR